MRQASALAVAAVLVACAAGAALAQPSSCPWTSFMPQPASVSCGANVRALTGTFTFAWDGAATAQADVVAFVDRALARYQALLFPTSPSPPQLAFRSSIFEDRVNASQPTAVASGVNGEPFTVAVHIAQTDAAPSVAALGQVGVDESYTLVLEGTPTGGSSLTAATVWGLLRGLETLSQAVQWTRYQGVSGYFVVGTPLVVTDAPRFPWRGLLLDTARNWHSPAAIRHVLDTMSALKLNVLHWHLADAESFPWAGSAAFPELATAAAYSPNATYTAQTVAGLIAYALDRGIRVVPEFDTPGHTAALGQAYPDIIADCFAYVRGSAPQLAWPQWDSVALDITKPRAKTVVGGLLTELASVFGDPFFHAGGDEVKTGCWAHVESMRTYMQQNGLATYNAGTGVWGNYQWQNITDDWERWVQATLRDLPAPHAKTAIVWEEAFQNSGGGYGAALLPSTVVNVWQEPHMLDAAVTAGHRVVNSYGWYVDRQNPTCSSDNATDPSQWCPTQWMWEWTWHTMYAVDPLAFLSNPTPARAALVLGGEITSFGESVDPLNFDARVWTRAPPVAERLWSPATVTSLVSAQTRFSALRCVWARRGVRMGPSVPAYCQLMDVYEADGVDGGSAETTLGRYGVVFVALFAVSGFLNAILCYLYCGAKAGGGAAGATASDQHQRLGDH